MYSGTAQDESLNTRRDFDAENRYSYILKRAFCFFVDETELKTRVEFNVKLYKTGEVAATRAGGWVVRNSTACPAVRWQTRAWLYVISTSNPQSLQPAKRSHNTIGRPHHQKDGKPGAKKKHTHQNKTYLENVHTPRWRTRPDENTPRSAQPRANSPTKCARAYRVPSAAPSDVGGCRRSAARL